MEARPLCVCVHVETARHLGACRGYQSQIRNQMVADKSFLITLCEEG